MLRSLTLAGHDGRLAAAPPAPYTARGGRASSRRLHLASRPTTTAIAARRHTPPLVAAAAASSSSSSAAAATTQLPRLAALDRNQSRVVAAARAQPLQRLSWRVGPDACALEVWYRPPAAAPLSSSSSSLSADAADAAVATTPGTPRPPVLLVHGLFRAAWSWEEAFLPALSASGRAAYAVSLRGQGASELSGGSGGDNSQGGGGAGAGTDVAAAVQEAGGVPMDVIMTDLEAVVARVAEHHAEEVARARRWEAGGAASASASPSPSPSPRAPLSPLPAPVLVGHSLGGMFVQEYLARLERAASSSSSQRQQEQQQQQQEPSSSSAPTPTTTPPPPISGAALLASATAGTVMDFARFASDVGLPEFLWQMWIVATGQHLRDLSVARYCWWPDEQPQQGDEGGSGGEAGAEGRQAAAVASEGVSAEEARRWHALIASSSRACPYVRGEVARWNPPPRQQQQEMAAADPAASSSPFPPVLALGGARDRIIRPWQVAAARAHWGADVAVLPGLTHDVMLGPGADRAFETLVAWLEQRVEHKREVVAP